MSQHPEDEVLDPPVDLDGLLDVRTSDKFVEIRLVASRDDFDDMSAVEQVGNPHGAGGIGISGFDGVIDRDDSAADGRRVTSASQTD